MVKPMLLLKILHCQRSSGKRKHAKVKGGEGTSQEEIKIMKKENDENSCRVCLQKAIIPRPIFGSEADDDISEALNIFGCIDVRIDDPHPKFLCKTCYSLLQGAILFRKTAQQSDELLKNPIIEEVPDVTLNYNDDINDRLDYTDENNDMDYEPVEDKKHKRKRKVKSQPEHSCKKCDMLFDTFKELDEHMLSEEHENMRHECPYCHKSYAPKYYKKHLTLHTEGAAYICDICGKNFILQGHFSRHRLTHFYKLPFKCSLCPYKGRFRESLKMHMRSHTGEKPYQCTECPSRFINKSNLNKHMLTHKDEPDFKCETCGRGFYTKRDLDLHLKIDHTGVKDHVCRTCGKAFGYRKQMMKHELKVHKRAKMRGGRTPIYLKVESMQQEGQNVVTES